MTLTFIQGQNAPLNRLIPMANDILIGIGWNESQPSGPTTDIVPAVIACGQDGKAVSREHFLFFNQLNAPEGAAIAYTSEEVGTDKEQVELSLSSIPSNITKIAFVLYVNPDLRSPGTFRVMRDGYIRLMDRTGNEVLRYPLPAALDLNALYMAELYRHNGEWKFRALGQGFKGGVHEVANLFGVSL